MREYCPKSPFPRTAIDIIRKVVAIEDELNHPARRPVEAQKEIKRINREILKVTIKKPTLASLYMLYRSVLP